MVFEELP